MQVPIALPCRCGGRRCEISRGAFARTVALPARVDGAKAKAVFKEGMLELTLPKLEKSKRHAVSVD